MAEDPPDSNIQEVEVEIATALATSGTSSTDSEEERWEEIARLKEEDPTEALRLMLQGVPDRLRSQVWNSLLHDGLRAELVGPAEVEEDDDGTQLDANVLRQIEVDLPRTFPEVPSFDQRRRHELGQLLRTYAVSNPDVGYCQSMNYVAGLLLLVFDNVTEAYSAFVVFMQVFALSGLYTDGFPLALTYSSVALRRINKSMSDLHDHFRKESFHFTQFPCTWFMSLFMKLLPLSLVKRFWDLLVLEGGDVLVTLCVITMQTLRPFLLLLDQDDLWKFMDLVKMPTANSPLERFWLRLFDQQLTGRNSLEKFQDEHQCVRELLRNTPVGSIGMDSLMERTSWPSQSRLADFMPASRTQEAVVIPAPVEASPSPSTPSTSTEVTEAPAPVIGRWEAARQTLSAVSLEMSWVMAENMRDGMGKLNKILAKPERRNGYK